MDLTSLLEVFFSLDNPVIYGIIIVLVLVVAIVLIDKEFISPLSKRKSELEIENTKLMALFAEIDPDPILRINNDGIIVDLNNAAIKEFKSLEIKGKNIKTLIPTFEFPTQEIDSNTDSIKIQEKYYSISVKKIKELGFVHIYLHNITERIKIENQIKEYQESLRKLRAKFELLNEEEKQKLGQELHDGVGQEISLLKLELQHLLTETGKDTNKINYLIKSTDRLHDVIREISHKLRPRILNEFGLIPALSSLIDRVNSNGNIRGFLSVNGDERKITKEFELNIYRICQEAITNILKHSNCNNFYIQLFFNADSIKLIISDDGDGFIISNFFTKGSSSLGLLNIKERASTFNGTFNIDSTLNEGTSLFIHFPITEKNND